jgi:protein-L-isoaspartate(D-aspartate) O-methyltransferase
MTEDHRPIALVMALRGQGILDPRVLAAMERTPRNLFVEAPFEAAAYENSALPIACGQTISQPYIVAYMSEMLETTDKHRVLEVGTGSGYQAAVLSKLCRMVYTIERHRPLLGAAEARFKTLKLHNVVTKHGDGLKGWPEQAPFDRIILTAVVPKIPAEILAQLKPGGILIAPVGQAPGSERFSQHLVKIMQTESGPQPETLIPVVFVPMVPGVPKEARKPDGEESKS